MTELPDFDTLKQLAKDDPKALDALQTKLSEEVINQSNNPQRLRSLYFNIQQKMALCNNPYQRCITINNMMRSKLAILAELIENPEAFSEIDNKAKILAYKNTKPETEYEC